VVVDYYKLAEQPFGVTPDPRFLYMTPTHREAMASIFYGVMENRGFSALIAPPGMGKTTLLFELLNRCGQSMRTVFLFQFQPSPEMLLRNLLAELGILDEGKDFAGMQEKLNQTVLQEAKQGKRIVVVVDETQSLPEPVLETLRMLSNFETSQAKLLHIVLSGQPQLAEMLFSSIEQLRQRISIMAVLRPLNAQETHNYIAHRLRVAGYKAARPLFTSAAYELIAKYSGGIPRNINNLCFNAMSLGFATKQHIIGREIIDEVFRDLNLEDNSGNGFQDGKWKATNTPGIGLARGALPRIPSSGGRLRFTLGAISIAAGLCLAGVFASDRLNHLPSQLNFAVPAPPPPVIAAETPSIPAETLTAPTDDATRPEAEPVADSKPESPDSQDRQVQEVVHSDPPAARPEPVRLVKAFRHETVYQLCMRNLARCDAGAIREIQQLNPWLHNASELQPGQPVRVPLEVPGRSRHNTRFAKSDSGATK